MSSKQQLAEAIRILTAVLNGIPDAPVKETRPAAVESSVPRGWQKAKIKAVSDKEIETKRGPSRKVSLKLAWIDNGEPVELWAGTLNEQVIAEAEQFDKGDSVLVKLEQKGDFWNLMGVSSPTGGIRADEVPF